MLFIQTEGASRSADSTATMLFIQTEDVRRLPSQCCLYKLKMCWLKKENKNLKVVMRFRVERELAQGNLCVELERGFFRCHCVCIYKNIFSVWHSLDNK